MGESKSEAEYHREIRLKTSRVEVSSDFLQPLINNASQLRIDHFLPCIIYVLDYRTQKYLYLSDGCLEMSGYTKEFIYEAGMNFVHQNIHPTDASFFEKSFSDRYINYIRNIEDDDLNNHTFRMTYRLKIANGKYIQTATQYKIALRDSKGYPLIVIGCFSDVSLFKKDNIVRMEVTRYDPKRNRTEEVEILHSLNYTTVLTKREHQILELIAQGLKTDEIAKELHISEYTVSTHRRNILDKLNCSNSAEAIVKVGLTSA